MADLAGPKHRSGRWHPIDLLQSANTANTFGQLTSSSNNGLLETASAGMSLTVRDEPRIDHSDSSINFLRSHAYIGRNALYEAIDTFDV